MNWLKAMEKVVQGSSVLRAEWEELYQVEVHAGRLQLRKPDGKWYDWVVGEEDMNAEDWEVV